MFTGALSDLEIEITARSPSGLDHPYWSGSEVTRSMDANGQRYMDVGQGEIGKTSDYNPRRATCAM